jgi:hypothetical protein
MQKTKEDNKTELSIDLSIQANFALQVIQSLFFRKGCKIPFNITIYEFLECCRLKLMNNHCVFYDQTQIEIVINALWELEDHKIGKDPIIRIKQIYFNLIEKERVEIRTNQYKIANTSYLEITPRTSLDCVIPKEEILKLEQNKE